MGSSNSKLYKNAPFPTNAGQTQVDRKIDRTKPAFGPSKMPHVMTPRAIAPRDAMGRFVIEDGTARLRVTWPDTHAGIIGTPFKADFMLGIMLHSTEHLNTYLKKNKMLGFCIIGPKDVVMLFDIPYDVGCAARPEAFNGFEGAAAALPASDHRLNEVQLQEVVARLKHAYLDYGVGALIMDHDKFVYQVMVPNTKDYHEHQVLYDAVEGALTAVAHERHAGSCVVVPNGPSDVSGQLCAGGTTGARPGGGVMTRRVWFQFLSFNFQVQRNPLDNRDFVVMWVLNYERTPSSSRDFFSTFGFQCSSFPVSVLFCFSLNFVRSNFCLFLLFEFSFPRPCSGPVDQYS
jgi:hypothetical protein